MSYPIPPNISLIEFSQSLVAHTGVLPLVAGAVVVGVGLGVAAWVGFAIWSGVQSWRLRRAGQPIVKQ